MLAHAPDEGPQVNLRTGENAGIVDIGDARRLVFQNGKP